MYSKPHEIPSVTTTLLENCEDVDFLLSTLQSYLLNFPKIEHYENPYDYIYAETYRTHIEDFVEILKNERDTPEKTSQGTFRIT